MSECSATFNQDLLAKNEFEVIQHMLDEMNEESGHTSETVVLQQGSTCPGVIGNVAIQGYRAKSCVS